MVNHEPSLVLHVAHNGSDDWSGLRPEVPAEGTDGPLGTIAGARDRIRVLRSAGQVTGAVEVLVHAGRYELAQTLRFEGQDLGVAGSPITYRAAGDGEVRLSGSRRLSGFVPVAGEVVGLDLTGTDLSSLPLHQLCFNGSWLRSARYPSFDPSDPVAGGWAHVPGDLVDIHEDGHGERDRFGSNDPRPATWSRPEDVEVVVFPRFNYGNDVVPVAEIDQQTNEVRLAGEAGSEIYPGDRYHFQNVREELDQPGEWCVDRGAGLLLMIPPSPVDQAVVETPVLESVIIVDGPPPAPMAQSPEKDAWFDHGKAMAHQHRPDSFTSGHLSFEGFVIEGCSGDAVIIRNVRAGRVVGCTIRTAGGFGVRLVSGADCAVIDCDIHDVGKGGAEASGGFRLGFSARYESCGHLIANNYIHHYGQVHAHVGGAAASGVGITIAHNLIHDGPRWGVLTRGNDNIVEYNHIRHVCLASADTSAIYLVDRDFTMRGTVIRHNHIHDVLGFDRVDGVWTSPAYAFGIYLDDFTSGVEIRGNLIHDTPRAGIYLHAGQDNLVEENLCLVDGSEAIYLRRWPPEVELRHCGTHDQGLRRNTVRRNVFGPATNPYRLSLVADGEGMVDLQTNHFEDNLVIGEPGPITADTVSLTWQQWQDSGNDTASASATPEEVLDCPFTLRADGPAAQLGIPAPELARMGIQPTPTRSTWPVVEAAGARERLAEQNTQAE